MTTQDIYFGIQTGLQLLVGGGVVWGVVWLNGVLKRAIETQKLTIAAQAERIKDLKTAIDAHGQQLQDVDLIHKMMQQVIDFVDPQKQLQREQAFQARVQRDADDRLKAWVPRLMELFKDVSHESMQRAVGDEQLLCNMLPFVYPPLRQALIEGTNLTPESKAALQQLAQTLLYTPVTDEASWKAFQGLGLSPMWLVKGTSRQPAREGAAP